MCKGPRIRERSESSSVWLDHSELDLRRKVWLREGGEVELARSEARHVNQSQTMKKPHKPW